MKAIYSLLLHLIAINIIKHCNVVVFINYKLSLFHKQIK